MIPEIIFILCVIFVFIFLFVYHGQIQANNNALSQVENNFTNSTNLTNSNSYRHVSYLDNTSQIVYNSPDYPLIIISSMKIKGTNPYKIEAKFYMYNYSIKNMTVSYCVNAHTTNGYWLQSCLDKEPYNQLENNTNVYNLDFTENIWKAKKQLNGYSEIIPNTSINKTNGYFTLGISINNSGVKLYEINDQNGQEESFFSNGSYGSIDYNYNFTYPTSVFVEIHTANNSNVPKFHVYVEPINETLYGFFDNEYNNVNNDVICAYNDSNFFKAVGICPNITFSNGVFYIK
ncbi:MAG: hypothetical protein ACP5IV_07430 [Caldisericia bacterium]